MKENNCKETRDPARWISLHRAESSQISVLACRWMFYALHHTRQSRTNVNLIYCLKDTLLIERKQAMVARHAFSINWWSKTRFDMNRLECFHWDFLLPERICKQVCLKHLIHWTEILLSGCIINSSGCQENGLWRSGLVVLISPLKSRNWRRVGK